MNNENKRNGDRVNQRRKKKARRTIGSKVDQATYSGILLLRLNYEYLRLAIFLIIKKNLASIL